MLLKAITVGEQASVGLNSTLAPGANVPSNTCFGPLSSSFEIEDANESYATLQRPRFEGPPWSANPLVNPALFFSRTRLIRPPPLALV
jgi:hypothetical protein